MEEQLSLFEMITSLPKNLGFIGKTLRESWPVRARVYAAVYGVWPVPTWVYSHMSDDQEYLKNNHVNKFMDFEVSEYSISPSRGGIENIYIKVKPPGYEIQSVEHYASLAETENEEDETDEESECDES